MHCSHAPSRRRPESARPPQGRGNVVLGIDGCRVGWVVVRLDAAGPQAAVHHSLTEIGRAYTGIAAALIDMPIGLPETAPRRCDTLARRRLGQRRASVFPVPCREAAYAEDYASACERNARRLGRRLSRQSWNLCRRIAEVDRYLAAGGGLPLVEAHPELCFAALQGMPMAESKRTPAGRAMRFAALAPHLPGVGPWFATACRSPAPRQFAPDDLLDALVLAVSARLPLATLPAAPPQDARGLAMAIAFPRTETMQPGSRFANPKGSDDGT